MVRLVANFPGEDEIVGTKHQRRVRSNRKSVGSFGNHRKEGETSMECIACSDLGSTPKCPTCGVQGDKVTYKSISRAVPCSYKKQGVSCKKDCKGCKGFQMVWAFAEMKCEEQSWTTTLTRPLNRQQRRQVFQKANHAPVLSIYSKKVVAHA